MAYGITSESQLIDVDKIGEGCQKILEGARYIELDAQAFSDIGASCTADVMSVDGRTLEGNFAQAASQTTQTASEVRAAAEAMYAEAVSVYNAQYAELQAYIQSQQKNN